MKKKLLGNHYRGTYFLSCYIDAYTYTVVWKYAHLVITSCFNLSKPPLIFRGKKLLLKVPLQGRIEGTT